MIRSLGVALIVGFVAGCGSVAATASPSSWLSIALPSPIAGWPVEQVTVGDQRLNVVVAVDRSQGLTGISDLGPVDGMLFDFGQPTDPALTQFWMRGVPIALDVAFFDASGSLLNRETMAPCPAEPCPRYKASGPFRWAIETPAGRFAPSAGARLIAR